MYLYALFLFMVPQTVPMLTNNQLQVLQHGTMTKVINSSLRLINGQCNLIDKSFGDSNAPLCCCRVLCRYEADSIFFFLLLLFVVKGRPASDNVLRFPVASKTSGRDECREEKNKKKYTYCFVNLFVVFFLPLCNFLQFLLLTRQLKPTKRKNPVSWAEILVWRRQFRR